jgi:hypothetical protein
MRQPGRLFRELGAPGFATFQLVVGGTVLAALVHPFFLAEILYRIVVGDTDVLFAALPATTVASGYLAAGVLGLLGLKRRGLLNSGWVLLSVPAHWLLLSLAAWRALYQLARDPYRWEKTEHGLAKTSRLADAALPAATEALPQTASFNPFFSAPRTDTSRQKSLGFPFRNRATG